MYFKSMRSSLLYILFVCLSQGPRSHGPSQIQDPFALALECWEDRHVPPHPACAFHVIRVVIHGAL